MIICLSGLASSGKSVVSEYLKEDHGFATIAFADPLKRIVKDVYGFSDAQLWGPSETRSEPDKRYIRDHTFLDSKCNCCGWDLNQENPPKCYLTVRYAIQQLGSEWGRECYKNTWVEKAFSAAKVLLSYPDSLMYTPKEGIVERIEQCSQGEFLRHDAPKGSIKGVVISDARFINELDASKKAGAFIVRIKAPGEMVPKWNHSSEMEHLEINDNYFNAIIDNNGTLEDLRKEVSGLSIFDQS